MCDEHESRPESVDFAMRLMQHTTQTAVALCEAIGRGENTIPLALGAYAEHLQMVAAGRARRSSHPAPPPGVIPASATEIEPGRWRFTVPVAALRASQPPRTRRICPSPRLARIRSVLRIARWAQRPVCSGPGPFALQIDRWSPRRGFVAVGPMPLHLQAALWCRPHRRASITSPPDPHGAELPPRGR